MILNLWCLNDFLLLLLGSPTAAGRIDYYTEDGKGLLELVDCIEDCRMLLFEDRFYYLKAK